MKAATKAIPEGEIIQLALEHQTLFAEALLNPPQPTPALRRAFQHHKELLTRDTLVAPFIASWWVRLVNRGPF